MCRWLTRDPIGYADGINQYAYCRTNPVNYADTWGFCGDGGFGAPSAKNLGARDCSLAPGGPVVVALRSKLFRRLLRLLPPWVPAPSRET